jgi:hypothetical protein
MGIYPNLLMATRFFVNIDCQDFNSKNNNTRIKQSTTKQTERQTHRAETKMRQKIIEMSINQNISE